MSAEALVIDQVFEALEADSGPSQGDGHEALVSAALGPHSGYDARFCFYGTDSILNSSY